VVNPANLAMFIGVLFSALPAMGLLYVMLNRYEGFFDEKRVFKYFAIGLATGAAITLLQVVVLRFHDPVHLLSTPTAAGLPILVAGYPLLESAMKTIVMNWRTMAGRRDSPYYGTALGLGFGAILTFIVVGHSVRRTLALPETALISHVELFLFFFLIFLLFLGGIMAHAAAGTVIASMTARNLPARGLLWGAVIGMPFYLGYYLVYTAPAQAAFWSLLIPFGVLLYGIVAVRWVIRNILDGVVPEELAREVRRDIRKKRMEMGR
jgi:hypothetical protein